MKLIALIFLFLLSFSSIANEISVTTYNVNYSFINEDLSIILDSIDSDIVCLQETNKKWELICKGTLQHRYPFMEFKHCCTAGGVAVLSKYPIKEVNYIENTAGWFPAMAVEIKKEENTIQLLNIHLKPKLTKKGRIGWKAYFKAEEIHKKELTDFISELKNDFPTIILGDFNEKDKGDALEWLQNEKSFTNALPQFDKKTKTWRFGILRSRFDHLFYNQELSCVSAEVSKQGKSDHFPVTAKLSFK